MILKSLMKNPVLAVGVIFFILYIYQLRDQGHFKNRYESLMPTSCRAVKVRLDKYMDKSWSIACNKNNLVIKTPIATKISEKNFKDLNILRSIMYKTLANSYVSISRYSPSDSLERTMIISLQVSHPQMTLNSISEGKHVFNLKSMKNYRRISQHIKSTIQVQEVIKK